MSNDDTQSTSGYVTGIGGDLSFQSGRPDSAFMNISECYVSRSGFTRLFTAVRYGKRYMLKCLKEDFRYTPVYHQALLKEFEIGLQLDHPNICRTISMEPGAQSDPSADIYSFGKVLEYMAEAVRSKSLARVGQKCAAADRARRPADIAQVRRLMADGERSFAVVNALLIALALVLLIVIGAMINSRQTKQADAVNADSVSEKAANKVMDSSLW